MIHNNKPAATPVKTSWYVSSTGQGLSLTIKGALLALVPFIIFGAERAGVTWTNTAVVTWIENLVAGVSAVTVLYGLARKVYYAVKRWLAKR